MPTEPLFPDLKGAPAPASSPSEVASSPEPHGPPRVQRPDRRSVRMMATDLDSLLPPDHNVRAVWAYVQRMNLTPLYDRIRARGSHAGRPAIDPALLMALWLFATLEGVGSARALNRLCTEHFAVVWLCGGVSVNYHTLSDFRVAHAELLEKLLVDGVTALLAAGVVDMARVAQDGVLAIAQNRVQTVQPAPDAQRCNPRLMPSGATCHRPPPVPAAPGVHR